MSEIVYLNGKLIPRSEAKLSAFDHGFLYGYGLFETMRAYSGHIFRLDRHVSRLRRSAQILGLADKLASIEIGAACLGTLVANQLEDARLRLSISAGEGDMTPDPGTCSTPTILVTAKSYIPLIPERYELGFKAVLSSLRRDSRSPLSPLKSTCYLNNILARMEAKAAGCDEAILLNEQGHLVEGSTSNIFLVSKGILVTPPLESGILPGITREAVLELAQALNIKAMEREIELEELTEAEEAFLTNSVLELMPLTWFEGKAIASGKAGQLTKELAKAYTLLINETTSRGV
jgi:branched-chain amino acid aminotransferase